MLSRYKKKLPAIFILLFLISCAKYDPSTGEKILIEPNPETDFVQYDLNEVEDLTAHNFYSKLT